MSVRDLCVDIELDHPPPPGHQTAAAAGICRILTDLVHLQSGWAFPGEIQRVAGLQVQTRHKFIAGNSSIERRLARAAFVDEIEPRQQVLSQLYPQAVPPVP